MRTRKSEKTFLPAKARSLLYLPAVCLMLYAVHAYGETKSVTVTFGSHAYQTFKTSQPGENHTLNINKATAAPNIARSLITAQDTQDQVIWQPAQIAAAASTHTYTMSGAALTEPLWVEIEGAFVKAAGGGAGAQKPDFVVTVVKVEIDAAYSDQISGRECNALPGQNPMYMGASADGHAYLQIAATAQPQQINNMCLVGVRHGTTVLDSGPIQQSMTPLDFAPVGSRQQYEIVGGVDQDSDGQLQNTEICTTLTPRALIITQSDYDYSQSVLNNYATITWGVGAQLVEAFIGDTIPPYVVNTQTTITSAALTHPLGAIWDANCSASTRHYKYIEGTETSDDVEEDGHTIAALKTSLNQYKTEVQTYFAQNTNVTEHTFGSWNWQANNLQFDGLALHFAFGHVTISGTVSVTVRRSDLKVTQIVYSGNFDDIYDFAYNGAYPSEHGATLQAGFPTLGSGGRVFRDRVEFSRDTTDFDYDFN